MPARFYFDGKWDEVVSLNESESQHLAKVLRVKEGAQVELFDGHGSRVRANVERIAKRSVQLRLFSQPERHAPQQSGMTLAVAPPKGDRFRWLIEKATELGVETIVPMHSERSVVNPRDAKLDKLRQTMIAACKQCGRDQLMNIEPVQPLETLPENVGASSILIGQHSLHQSLSQLTETICGAETILVLIGPEGGFSEKELSLFEAWGAIPVCISPHILRIETAAIAVASLFAAMRSSHSG